MAASCQTHYVLTPTQPTEAALVANAYQNGLSIDLNIDYERAYRNLKQAYGRCVAFTDTENEIFVFTDNRLEPQLEMGTLFAKTEHGVFLHKATVEALRNQQTRFTLYVPHNYPFPRYRFKQDIRRALGQDRECNVATT